MAVRPVNVAVVEVDEDTFEVVSTRVEVWQRRSGDDRCWGCEHQVGPCEGTLCDHCGRCPWTCDCEAEA